MRMKKMNEKKKRYDWCVSYTCSSTFSGPIDVPQSQKMFLEEDGKKRISISHLLEGNWNSRFLVV